MNDVTQLTAVPPPPTPSAPQAGAPDLPGLRAAATALEEAFLAEMLKQAGFLKPPESFGGGAGEEAFSSMMVDAYARELTASGGIGLAESIFNALVRDGARE